LSRANPAHDVVEMEERPPSLALTLKGRLSYISTHSKLSHFLKEETGYQWIQGTKPTTLAFAFRDSPAGLAAWFVERFRTWTGCKGNPENALSRDEMLSDIMLYWVTGAIGSSFWPYYGRMHGPWPIPEGSTVDVPTGYVEFPKEILRPRARWPSGCTPTSGAGR
jgi:hypothetical protein